MTASEMYEIGKALDDSREKFEASLKTVDSHEKSRYMRQARERAEDAAELMRRHG